MAIITLVLLLLIIDLLLFSCVYEWETTKVVCGWFLRKKMDGVLK